MPKKLCVNDLKISVTKCNLGQNEINFLCFHASSTGIKPTDKTREISHFPLPTNSKRYVVIYV